MKPDSHHEVSRRGKIPGPGPEDRTIVKWGRWWFSLAYVLATLLAQGVHDHDRGAEEPFLESSGECDNTRPHVASHEVGTPDGSPGACPSCQFRSQHSLSEPTDRPLAGLGVAAPPAAQPPSTPSGSPLRPRCRAPPIV